MTTSTGSTLLQTVSVADGFARGCSELENITSFRSDLARVCHHCWTSGTPEFGIIFPHSSDICVLVIRSAQHHGKRNSWPSKSAKRRD